jgi:hypothetical protein
MARVRDGEGASWANGNITPSRHRPGRRLVQSRLCLLGKKHTHNCVIGSCSTDFTRRTAAGSIEMVMGDAQHGRRKTHKMIGIAVRLLPDGLRSATSITAAGLPCPPSSPSSVNREISPAWAPPDVEAPGSYQSVCSCPDAGKIRGIYRFVFDLSA